MFFTHSCASEKENSDLIKFKSCYLNNQTKPLFEVVRLLDEKVNKEFPSQNTDESYRLFAEDWMMNIRVKKKPFSDKEINDYSKILNSSDLFGDFYVKKDSFTHINYEGSFMICLESINNKGINESLEWIGYTGDYYGIVSVMSLFAEQKERKLEPIHFLFFKINLILTQIIAPYNKKNYERSA